MTLNRLHQESGAAAVEFALVLVLLVTILVGIIELGRAYNAQITLQHAAREGARVLAITKNGPQAITRTKAAALPFVTLTDAEIAAPSTCTTGIPTTVTISHNFSLVTPFFGTTLAMNARGEMRCGG